MRSPGKGPQRAILHYQKPGCDRSQLALELGCFDQAHLINDFKSTVGYAPRQCRKLVGENL